MTKSALQYLYVQQHHRGTQMKAFIIGTVFGLVLATVGFSGIARMLDRGVDSVKTHSQEMAK